MGPRIELVLVQIPERQRLYSTWREWRHVSTRRARCQLQESKLSVSYIQASLIPVLDFGDHGRKPRVWDGYNDHSFRIGFGPYIGYRISSHTKVVYNDGDGRERDKDRDGFFLNNFRYGARLQLGYRSTDLFFNYDLNELFQDDKGPRLNAFSFGVIF